MAHDHHHHNDTQNIKVAFFLNLGFTFLEFFGGLIVNSIAIMSDALHDLGDSLSIGLSWFLQDKSKQGASSSFTFGYKRFSLLGALINSLILIAGSVWVISAAVGRIIEPEPTDAAGMLLFAIIGVAVNGYAAWKVSHGNSLNERVISWHFIEDVLGWAAILIGAIILLFWKVPYLDPILSLMITAFILWNVVKRLKETLYIFLQGKPVNVDLNEIEIAINGINKVHSLHHTHSWSLEGEHHVFTTHLVLNKINSFRDILTVKKQVKEALKNYGFAHFTVEVELNEESCSLR